MTEIYGLSIVGLVILCLVPPVLGFLVGPLKGTQGLPGGPIVGAGDDSFLFRADRAHVNSVEAIPFFVAPAILGIMTGVGAGLLALLVWSFLAVRLAYIAVYLRGGAMARGGNLRTVLHVLGSLATFVVIGAVILNVI